MLYRTQTTTFTFKRYNFHQKNTINEVLKKSLAGFARAHVRHFIIIYKTLIWGIETLKNIKKTNVMIVPVRATDCILSSLCKC